MAEMKEAASKAAPINQQDKGTDNLGQLQRCPDYIGMIGAEFDKLIQASNEVPEVIGMLRIRSANRTLKEASLRPNPDALWLTLWYAGEVCCLFADSNLGKSIYAVQIATDIAKTQKVLYFDFELSDKQFQLRYTDKDTGTLYQFPDNFYRVELNPETLNTDNFEDNLISNIEGAALQCGANVLVIDNLTYLCIASEKGDVAGSLMMRLTQLKKKYGWSLLILAHTPKRPLSSPLTQNDLAGSKKLYNFFDSVFAIGQSAKDSNLRYIKQLKVRYGEYVYDADNVIVYSIEQINSFLQFVPQGYATEREHLKELSDKDETETINRVKELISKGDSYRNVAHECGISLAKVQRILKK